MCDHGNDSRKPAKGIIYFGGSFQKRGKIKESKYLGKYVILGSVIVACWLTMQQRFLSSNRDLQSSSSNTSGNHVRLHIDYITNTDLQTKNGIILDNFHLHIY